MKTLTSRTVVIVLWILGLWIGLQPCLSRAASLEVNGDLSFASTAGVLTHYTYGGGSTLDPAGDTFSLYDGTNSVKWMKLWYGSTGSSNYLGVCGPNSASSGYSGIYAQKGDIGITFGDSGGRLGVGTNYPSYRCDIAVN